MNVSSMLRDLSRVLEFSNSKQAAVINGQQQARQVGVEDKYIAATALRLLSFSCQVGWAAVSDLLLPIVSAMAATASELVADLERVCDEGLTLLHHVVRSGNASLVSMHVLLSEHCADLCSPGHDAHGTSWWTCCSQTDTLFLMGLHFCGTVTHQNISLM